MVTKLLEKQLPEFYHGALCHPRETHKELSTAQHLYWKNLSKTLHELYSKYEVYQFLQRNKK